MTYILAHDLGTSSNKAVLTTMAGEIVASASATYDVITPQPGWAEQDPSHWWEAVARCGRQVLSDAGVDPKDVSALVFAGQMQGTLPVDIDGVPLMNCLTWLDARAVKQAREATGGAIRIEGYGAVRLAKWLWLTNGAPQSGGQGHLREDLVDP